MLPVKDDAFVFFGVEKMKAMEMLFNRSETVLKCGHRRVERRAR